MNRLMTAVPLVLACAVAGGAFADDAAKGPRLTLESKQVDFGVIMHGAKASVSVELENTGDEPLVLRTVKPSCGCTVADYPKTIAPGEKGTLGLTFDSNERPPGYQSFRVAIYTNDPTQKDMGGYCTLVALRGEVRTLYRVAPHGAYFGEVIRGVGVVEKVVTITGKGEAKGGFTASLASDLPDYLQVELGPLPAQDKRKGVQVRIRLLPHVPFGQMDHALLFKTNVKEQPVFRVPVTGLVNRRITGPPSVHFGPVDRAKGDKRLVVLERRDTLDGIAVVRVHYDTTRLAVTHKVISARRVEAEIKLIGDAPPGPFATEVRFFLDDPDQQLVVVPVYGRVQPKVRVEPPLALLPSGTKPGAVVASFLVRVPEGRAVKGAAASGGLQAAVKNVDGTFEVEVRLPSGEAPSGDQRLELETDVPGEEAVVVPLVAR